MMLFHVRTPTRWLAAPLAGAVALIGLLHAELVSADQALVREEPLTLPHYVKALVPGTEQDRRPRYERKRGADAVYRSVVLENEFLRVQAIPELGGVRV